VRLDFSFFAADACAFAFGSGAVAASITGSFDLTVFFTVLRNSRNLQN